MAISAKTRTVAIFGHPVGHSLSPAMHNAAFAASGLDFVYVAHDVLPETLPIAMAGIRALGYRGLSITIPHKVAALDLVDEVDPVARAIGCINTVVNEGGRLIGYNSDGMGALSALRSHGSDPVGQRVAVIGSGGAARAISMTLAYEAPPSQITILGIDAAELERLRHDLALVGRSTVVARTLDEAALRASLAESTLVLQTTPVGMAPKIEATPIPKELLGPQHTVFDAVYTPRKTQLLKDAEARGAMVVLGLEMFLGQALVQFRLFTGQEPPSQVMRAVVEASLGA